MSYSILIVVVYSLIGVIFINLVGATSFNEVPIGPKNPFKHSVRQYFADPDEKCKIHSVDSRGEGLRVDFDTEDYEISKFAYASRRAAAAILSLNNEIIVIDLKIGYVVSLRRLLHPCSKLRMSADGLQIACAAKGELNELLIFDSVNLNLIKKISNKEKGRPSFNVDDIVMLDFEFSLDGRSINFIKPAFIDSVMNCYWMKLDLETLECSEIIQIQPYSIRASASPDQRHLAVTVNGNVDSLVLYDIESKESEILVKSSHIGLASLSWARDGLHVFTEKYIYGGNVSELRITSVFDTEIEEKMKNVFDDSGIYVLTRRSHSD